VVHGAVRHLFQLIGAIAAVLLIAVPLFVWRLSEGPIALEFLTPYIQDALSAKDGSVSVRLDTTVLAAGGDRVLEIHAYNVRAYGAGSDQPLAQVPDMALSLSGRALLMGEISPNSIRLYGPKVRLVRDAGGAMQWGIGLPDTENDAEAPMNSGQVVAAIKDALLGAPDSARPGRTLQVFAIRKADVLVDDRANGVLWHAPDAEITVRRGAAGLSAQARAGLDLAGEKGELALDATYAKADGAVAVNLSFSGVRPAMLARFGGATAQLAVIDMPLAGTVRARLGGDGGVTSLAFQLSGGAGSLDLPPPFAVRHPVGSASLRGEFGPGLASLDLTEARVSLYGATVSLTAHLDGLGGDTRIKANGSIRDMPVDRVRDVWPAGLGDNARDWVVPNLSRGMVREASINLAARSASGRFDDVVLDGLAGEIKADGVNVDYLHPMPPARNVSALCAFDADSFRIGLKAGEVYGLRLKEGTVNLTGLDKTEQFADIELAINGPATDALRLIDNPPLKYAQALGIEPAKVAGDAQAKLRLKFPLLKALRLDDVGVKAQAVVKSVRIPKVMMGQDLTDGTLSLDVDAKGLDATGPVVLGGINGQLAWRENFSAKGAPFRSRYQLKAPAVTEDQRKSLGLDGVPFVAPFIAGPVGGDVTATFWDGGRGEIEAKVDLAQASMALPGLGWTKETGKPGTADVSVKLDKKLVAAIPRFAVQAGDMDVQGSVAFSNGSARRVEFARLIYGRTNGDGVLTIRPDKGGLDVSFKGASFDAEPALSQKKPDGDKPPPMTVNATARSLWVSEKGAITNAAIAMQRDAQDWQTVSLKGNVGGAKSISVTLGSGGPKRRNFQVVSDDAGATFKTFDIYADMSGGTLSVDGYVDDAKPDQPYIGTLKVSDYHVRNAPVLARLLTIAALAGIVDVLQGEGVGFSSLDAPFTLADGLLTVHDGRAWGAALGLTAKGQVDLEHSRLALEGTVVPAYVLNSVLGNIPVLGWLITGGDKGGGVIAVNYSMKGPTANPSILVNPLSALTPGFLRKLFNIFDDGSSTDARKGAK
jgi:hypothetical protein